MTGRTAKLNKWSELHGNARLPDLHGYRRQDAPISRHIYDEADAVADGFNPLCESWAMKKLTICNAF